MGGELRPEGEKEREVKIPLAGWSLKHDLPAPATDLGSKFVPPPLTGSLDLVVSWDDPEGAAAVAWWRRFLAHAHRRGPRMVFAALTAPVGVN